MWVLSAFFFFWMPTPSFPPPFQNWILQSRAGINKGFWICGPNSLRFAVSGSMNVFATQNSETIRTTMLKEAGKSPRSLLPGFLSNGHTQAWLPSWRKVTPCNHCSSCLLKKPLKIADLNTFLKYIPKKLINTVYSSNPGSSLVAQW